jgi:putative ABC transport system permease protein
MFKSYITIAIRNLLAQKGFSLINITGLTVGLASALIIFLFVREDLSYDKFNRNYDNIARLLTIDKAEGVSSKLVGVTPPALGPAVAAEIPEVKASVRINGGGKLDLSYGDNVLKCEAGFRTESSFFQVFDFPIIEGEKEKPLDEPNSIVITETLAKRIFGTESAIGKTIKLNQTIDLHVTAVAADPPRNSHLRFDLLRSMTPAQNEDGFRQYLQSWQGLGMFTYVLLDKPLNKEEFDPKLKALSDKNNAVAFFVPTSQPLSDVHLRSQQILFETNANKSDELNVYVLSIITALILVLAAVNFINLVTARSASRAKEVGLRKVAGAIREQLISQHLVESILVTAVSAVLAVGIVFLTLPLLNNIYQRFADFNALLEWENVAWMLAFVVLLGTVAGLYPAFVLSSFKPVSVLTGSFKNSSGGQRLRKALVVVQFTISIALMVGTGIVYQQMDFIFSANLGYERDQVVTLQLNGQQAQNAQTLRNELMRNDAVASVGTASARIGQQLGRTQIYPEGRSSTDNNIITSIMVLDENYIPTMGMEMAAGRNFSLDFKDSLNVIINEELARFLKWDNDAIGRKIGLQSGPNPTDQTQYTIVGVLRDFHFATIRHKLEPLFILFNQNNGSVAIKLKAGQVSEGLAHIEATWKKVIPGSPFEYAFLDDQFTNLYRNERAFAQMFTHFTVLAMFIAGLGLFALSAFTVAQREKEIGIRKVLGASNTTILYNLSAQFMLLIVVSFVLASGIAFVVMSKWLEEFQYSIEIGVSIFLVAGAVSIAIAMMTISWQALKAVVANPVKALREQ